jgi:hypothetical protein
MDEVRDGFEEARQVHMQAQHTNLRRGAAHSIEFRPVSFGELTVSVSVMGRRREMEAVFIYTPRSHV